MSLEFVLWFHVSWLGFISRRPQARFTQETREEAAAATKSKKKDEEEDNWEMPGGDVPSWNTILVYKISGLFG